KQKIQNQESVLDSMHSEVSLLLKATKEAHQTASGQVDKRLKTMEKNLDKLVSDLKQFKKHANDSSSSLSQIQKKLAEQEEIGALQAQQIKDLESALRHLASALQSKTTKDTPLQAREYCVKSGDTLEKIAKDHGSTIQLIKKENNLEK